MKQGGGWGWGWGSWLSWQSLLMRTLIVITSPHPTPCIMSLTLPGRLLLYADIKLWPQKQSGDTWKPCPCAALRRACLWCYIGELKASVWDTSWFLCIKCATVLPLVQLPTETHKHKHTQTIKVVLQSRRANLFSFVKPCIHFSQYALYPGGLQASVVCSYTCVNRRCECLLE